MARKRSVFFRAIQPLLKLASKLLSIPQKQVLILSLIAVFFTTGIPPVVSQMSTQQAEQLVQQGQQYYNAQQYSEAVKALQQAYILFAARKDELKQAIALSNLSLTYQQLGEWKQAQQVIEASIKLLQPKRNIGGARQLKVYAQSLDIQSRMWYSRGQPEPALKSSQQATNIYKQLQDQEGMVGSQINSAQALQVLGLYQEAKTTLEEVKQTLAQIPNFSIQSKGLISLGNVLRAVGELKQSQETLKKSLALVEKLPSSQAKAEIKSTALLSLGNTIRARGNLERDRLATSEYDYMPWRCVDKSIPELAAKFYQNASVVYQQVMNEPPSATRMQAKLNSLSLLLDTKQLPAQNVWDEIQLSDLPKGRNLVYAQINLAKSLACVQQKNNIPISSPLWNKIDNLLVTAVKDAREIQDTHAESYALGNRGGLYEYFAWQLRAQQRQSTTKEYQNYIQTSKQLTQKALLLAQPIDAPDIAYQWQWQLGRLLEVQEGNTDEAIKEYEAAVNTLKVVRSDLLAINSDVQFSFRDNVEPVYRELVDLLLRTEGTSKPKPENIEKAIKQIDFMQLAELENFLRCNLSNYIQIDKVVNREDPTSAVFYPIVLQDRLEVILKLPNKLEPIHYYTSVKRIDLENTLEKFRVALTSGDSGRDVYEPLSKQVYDWLIQPSEKYLNSGKIKTLVFVLDGSLREIPMSALWDGKQFLIKKYAVAVTPGLQLLGPKRLERKQLKALIAGLTQGGTVTIEGRTFKFDSLPNVGTEADNIKKILPNSVQILNEEFKYEKLRSQINSSSYPIVHIATHGNFSSNPEETFILTASNNQINVNELQNLLKDGKQNRPDAIELLVFSACETATGDKRATLGMAGVAVRAGAGSTMATLWSVDDKSTGVLVEKFYRNFKQELDQKRITKAEALQKAQLDLLESTDYNHPYFWSPFVLIGNWL